MEPTNVRFGDISIIKNRGSCSAVGLSVPYHSVGHCNLCCKFIAYEKRF